MARGYGTRAGPEGGARRCRLGWQCKARRRPRGLQAASSARPRPRLPRLRLPPTTPQAAPHPGQPRPIKRVGGGSGRPHRPWSRPGLAPCVRLVVCRYDLVQVVPRVALERHGAEVLRLHPYVQRLQVVRHQHRHVVHLMRVRVRVRVRVGVMVRLRARLGSGSGLWRGPGSGLGLGLGSVVSSQWGRGRGERLTSGVPPGGAEPTSLAGRPSKAWPCRMTFVMGCMQAQNRRIADTSASSCSASGKPLMRALMPSSAACVM
eukprot:scaffold6650_cov65-Phaeocystis_antarctica.AAC.2